MERTKMNEKKPRWKKLGGGSLRIGSQLIKPGQIFEAYPEEISPAFRNMVQPISGNTTFPEKVEVIEPAPVNVVKTVYTIQPKGKTNLWFDVVDPEGKIINEKSLKKEVAEKLVEDLAK